MDGVRVTDVGTYRPRTPAHQPCAGGSTSPKMVDGVASEASTDATGELVVVVWSHFDTALARRQSSRLPGSGGLVPGGAAGDVMQQPAQVALSWLWANAERNDVDAAQQRKGLCRKRHVVGMPGLHAGRRNVPHRLADQVLECCPHLPVTAEGGGEVESTTDQRHRRGIDADTIETLRTRERNTMTSNQGVFRRICG